MLKVLDLNTKSQLNTDEIIDNIELDLNSIIFQLLDKYSS